MTLWAFADESGLQANPPYCVVAGYIANPREWTRFRKAWLRLLNQRQVPAFHAIDFFARVKRGCYAGWSDEDSTLFMNRLTQIISEHDLYPIGAAVDVPAFNSLTVGERRFLTGGFWNHQRDRFETQGKPTQPYFVAFMRFLLDALGLTPDGTRLHLVFDRQNIMESRAIETFNEIINRTSRPDYISQPGAEKLGIITYSPAGEEAPLQAADLLAHLWYSYLANGSDMSQSRFQAMETLTSKQDTFPVFEAGSLEANITGQVSPEVHAKMRASK